MKVLHIIDTYWIGGAQSLLKGFFEYQKENNNIYLYNLRTREFNIDIDHTNVFTNKSKSKISLKPLKEITNIIKKYDINILHCHLPRSQVFGYLIKTFYCKNIKLVFHEHGEIIEHPIILPILFKYFDSKVNSYIAVSEHIKNTLIHKTKIQENKVEVIYNYVNDSFFSARDVPPQYKFIQKDCLTIGFASRLFKRKGWRDLLAASVILKENKNIKFLIAGKGKDQKCLLKLIKKHNLQNTVEYLGYVNDMQGFFAKIDILVIPSHWEGMPVLLLEAWAYGIPVVCTKVPGIEELAIDMSNCLLAEAKNPLDLSLNFMEIHNSPEKILNIVKNANTTVIQFNIKYFIKNLNGLYLKI